MENKQEVSKLEAALRQLQTAIALYFSNGDPVSIHTLTAAAHTIIADVNRKRGDSPTPRDSMLQLVPTDMHQTVLRKLNAAQNFFKHADRDADEKLTFDPRSTELLLWESCHTLYLLTGNQNAFLTAFHVWFVSRHPKLFDTALAISDDMLSALHRAHSGIKQMSRSEFFGLCMSETDGLL